MSNTVQTKDDNKSVFVMIPAAVRKTAKAKYETSGLFDKTNGKDVDFFKDRLITYKDVQELGDLVNIIYPTSKYTPTRLKESNDDLLDLGTVVRYFPRDHKKSKDEMMLAYVMREFRNSYRIFINEDCEDEAWDSMDLHEKGHILFNHTQSVKIYLDQFRKELDLIWDLKIAKYFENSVIKNSKDKIVKMLFMEFSNIAQDMEINSKLFDNNEWIKAKKTMARSAVIVHYLALEREFDSLSGLIKNDKARKIGSKEYEKIAQIFEFIRINITQRIDGKEGDFQFCYPANKGWPEKLDWMTYMILLIKNIDETMQQVIQQIQSMMNQQGAGNSQGNGSGQGNSPGNSQGGGKQISQDVLDKYMDKASAEKDAASDANGDALDELDDDDSDQDGGMSKGSRRNKGGNGKGGGSGAVECEFETCDTFDNFTKFLRKNCLGKKNRKWNSDVLYNSNRGKFSSRVVVPRRHLIEKWMPTDVTIIVDVSGSVPTDYVERVINSIVDVNSGIDLKHSHIIFCDTQVTSDEIMSARTKGVYAGGGTCMANGINYVAKKGYLKRATDKLFLISDFEDNLSDWVTAVEKLPGIHWAIGYNVSSKKEAGETLKNNSRYRDDNSEFGKRWNSAWKTIFITEKI